MQLIKGKCVPIPHVTMNGSSQTCHEPPYTDSITHKQKLKVLERNLNVTSTKFSIRKAVAAPIWLDQPLGIF